jgi:DNA-binding Lrp family transcriptional regulator
MEEHTIVDDVNRKILELLMENSRIPYSELADAVGITARR